MTKSNILLLMIAAMTFSSEAMAYMGPGAGITAIGCLIALGAGIWYTFKGFLWLPLKRMFKKTSVVDEAQNQTVEPAQNSELDTNEQPQQINQNK